MSSGSVYYTGVSAVPIKRAEGEFVLAGGQAETLALQVHPEEYLDKLVEYCMVKCHAVVRVKETGQTWSDEDDFVMDKPSLSIRVSTGQAVVLSFCFVSDMEII